MIDRVDPRTAYPRVGADGRTGAAYDAGLRSYMLSIYNMMASAILLTGVVALAFFELGYAQAVFQSPGFLKYVIMFAPLALVLGLSFGISRMSEGTARTVFWGYAVLMGLSLSTIFLVYTGQSIATTFFATSAAFAGLSLYGYTTKKDLSGLGTFLIMGLIGIIVASLINLFLQSSMFSMIISAVGVLVFAGLTAYDTQKIKNMYFEIGQSEFRGKSVIMGALTLYLDFINLFLFMLRFMGGNRD